MSRFFACNKFSKVSFNYSFLDCELIFITIFLKIFPRSYYKMFLQKLFFMDVDKVKVLQATVSKKQLLTFCIWIL